MNSRDLTLRNLDLNLLLVFDAIYNERSISKAALKLHLSQPTVSNALRRLRERMQDPLFERSSQGVAPTARAKALAEPIRQALMILERGLRGDDTFDFQHSSREFVIAVEDYGEAIVLPRFVDWLAGVAPNIRITIRSEPYAQLKGEMRDGAIDLAFDYFAPDDQTFCSQRALTEDLLSLSRRDHPLVGEKLSLETYLALRHIVLAPNTRAISLIDLALAKRDLQRQIAVVVPHFLSMPLIVQSSNLICTIPRRMAHLYADHFRLSAHEVPLRIPNFPIYLIWHESISNDASHTWLRNHLLEFCQRL